MVKNTTKACFLYFFHFKAKGLNYHDKVTFSDEQIFYIKQIIKMPLGLKSSDK